MQTQNSQVTAASPVPAGKTVSKASHARRPRPDIHLLRCGGGRRFRGRQLALLADAAHMFTDVAALILAFVSMTLADTSWRLPPMFKIFIVVSPD